MGELDKTYGAAFVGVYISAILYGVTNMQTFVYFRTYPEDKLRTKLSVCALWVLDSLHVAFCMHMLYWYLITNYGIAAELLVVHWSFKAQIIVNAVVVASVQTLYMFRVLRLDATAHGHRGCFRFGPISVAVFIAVCDGIAGALVLCYEITLLTDFQTAFKPADLWITYYPLANATFIDTVIAASLCYRLSRCRTGFQKTDSLITWLMFYALNTGVITSICSLTAVIMLAALPGTFLMIAVEFLMIKLYVNSYLAMLNARSSLRYSRDEAPEEIVLQPRSMLSSESAGEVKGTSWVTNSGTTVPGVGGARLQAHRNRTAAGVDLRHSGYNDPYKPVQVKSLDGLSTDPVHDTNGAPLLRHDVVIPDLGSTEVRKPALHTPLPALVRGPSRGI